MEDVKKEVTTEELRENILANISEDVAKLLTSYCVKLGRRELMRKLADEPRWCGWDYTSDQPKSAEEYALGNNNVRKGALKEVPNWASKRAVYDFLRKEFEEDYAEYIEYQKDSGKWPAEETEEGDGE